MVQMVQCGVLVRGLSLSVGSLRNGLFKHVHADKQERKYSHVSHVGSRAVKGHDRQRDKDRVVALGTPRPFAT